MMSSILLWPLVNGFYQLVKNELSEKMEKDDKIFDIAKKIKWDKIKDSENDKNPTIFKNYQSISQFSLLINKTYSTVLFFYILTNTFHYSVFFNEILISAEPLSRIRRSLSFSIAVVTLYFCGNICKKMDIFASCYPLSLIMMKMVLMSNFLGGGNYNDIVPT